MIEAVATLAIAGSLAIPANTSEYIAPESEKIPVVIVISANAIIHIAAAILPPATALIVSAISEIEQNRRIFAIYRYPCIDFNPFGNRNCQGDCL